MKLFRASGDVHAALESIAHRVECIAAAVSLEDGAGLSDSRTATGPSPDIPLPAPGDHADIESSATRRPQPTIAVADRESLLHAAVNEIELAMALMRPTVLSSPRTATLIRLFDELAEKINKASSRRRDGWSDNLQRSGELLQHLKEEYLDLTGTAVTVRQGTPSHGR